MDTRQRALVHSDRRSFEACEITNRYTTGDLPQMVLPSSVYQKRLYEKQGKDMASGPANGNQS